MIQKNKKFYKKKNSDQHFLNKNLNLKKQKNRKGKKIIITNYLHTNYKIKKGIFLKNISYNEILYPIPLNLKLINEYLKKK